MNEPALLIAGTIGLIFCGGLFVTRWWRSQADSKLVRARLNEIFHEDTPPEDQILEIRDPEWSEKLRSRSSLVETAARIVETSGTGITFNSFVMVAVAVALLPIALSLLFDGLFLLACVLSIALPTAFFITLRTMSARRRMKFIEQLPGAIDLMISVLRSGLSVPQALKSVGEEMPDPCGPEFLDVLHRVNLGQSLADSLSYTVDKYKLFELDLLRRAAAIQIEIGGSLAELLEKTNSTLRQRLKLHRQVKVLTAQSRLSGTIIAMLPFFMAIAFQLMNPGYLTPLYETNFGRVVLAVAFAFQIVGVIIIRKLSTIKV